MQELGKALILFGCILALLGLALVFGGQRLGVGRLPGDIRIQRPGFQLTIPLTSCLVSSLLLSLLLSAVAYLISRLR